MRRLGYSRYAAQGTDAGAGVAGLLGMVDAEHVVGIHLTGTSAGMPFGPPIALDGLAPEDRVRAEHFNAFQTDGLGYLHLQSTRPQTLSYGLTDSPVAQLAWIVEKYKEWTYPATALPEDKIDRDQMLTNVTIAWFTGAGGSSAHATYEGMQVYRQMAASWAEGDGGHEMPAGPPTGYAVFAGDNTIRSRARPGRCDHPLVQLRPRRALPGHGGARPAGRRRARVLPAAALTGRVRQAWVHLSQRYANLEAGHTQA